MPAKKPYHCPANGAVCSQQCALRHDCAREPERMMELVERLDGETERALIELMIVPRGHRYSERS